MSNLNVIVLQGNLTADPEIVGQEQNVARFTVAVNNGFGEKKETAFIDCVAFGKQVEVIKEHFAKGKQVIVKGSIRQNRWEAEDGTKRSKLEVILDNFGGFSFVSDSRGARASTSEDVSEPASTETATASTGGKKERLF
jgi:single-strand DNA-binding protein